MMICQKKALSFLLLSYAASAFVCHRSGWVARPKAFRDEMLLASSVVRAESEQRRAPREGGGGRPQQQRPPRRGPPYGSNAGGGGNNAGGGGSTGPVLRLQNPMKIQRVVEQTPAEDFQSLTQEPAARAERNGSDRGPRERNDDRGARPGGPSRGGREVGSISTGPPRRRPPGGPGGDKPDSSAPAAGSSKFDVGFDRVTVSTDKGGKRDFGKVPRKVKEPDRRGEKLATDGGRNAGRNSLRIDSGRKGRSSELSSRRGSLKRRDRAADKDARAEAAIERKTVYLPEGSLTVSQLSEYIDEKPVAIIKMLMADLGVMASMTQSLDPATCVAVVEGFGKIVGGEDDYEEWLDAEDSALATGIAADDDDEEDLKPRPPVVTIMGHVDHGKTSLLDAIRQTRVTAGEAGGITQHIAAYQVEHEGRMITFIDTPGHAAFTDMRERGANMTDIVILVVAADDGVKQQTTDSIMCARQAGVPLVVAINKCDLETADPVRVMTDLTAYDVLTEEFGGQVLSSQISAKEGRNLNDLLEKVLLQAELQDLKANPDRPADGIVVEALVEKGLGTVATTLVKRGTLRIGDSFVAGETYGRVRALLSTNDQRTRLTEAGPSTPVRVVGFEGVPSAGDILVVTKDEQTARELAESRTRIARERISSSYQAGLMDSVAMTFGSSKERREMCVVVKADVQGSAEALTRALRELRLENDEATVTIKVLVSEAGEVSKSDIAIASVTPRTRVIAFNVAASYAAMEDARTLGIPIEYYNVIYDAIDSVESRMQEVLSPTPDGEYVGSAIVQEVFNIGGTGNIAGSRCTDGMLRKGGNVRVMRGDKILAESRIASLRNFKQEVDSIEEGNDCGIGLTSFEDFLPNDVIECYLVR